MIGRTNSATGGGGGEKYGNAYNVPETLPAPALTVISDTTGVSITWTAVPDAEGYLIFYGKSEEMPSSLKNYEHYEELAPTATSYRINISESFDTWYVGVFPVKEKYFTRDTSKEKSICTIDDYFVKYEGSKIYATDGLDKHIGNDLVTQMPEYRFYGMCLAEDDMWVSCGVTGLNNSYIPFYYSSNHGATWIKSDHKTFSGYGVNNGPTSYIRKKKVFVAMAYDNNTYYSKDGKSWSIAKAGMIYASGAKPTLYPYNEERFIARSVWSGREVYYSDDGINWIMVNAPSGMQGFPCWNGSEFLWIANGMFSSSSGFVEVGTIMHQNGTVIPTNLSSIIPSPSHGAYLNNYFSMRYIDGTYYLDSSAGLLASKDLSTWVVVCPDAFGGEINGGVSEGITRNKKLNIFMRMEQYLWISKDGWSWTKLKNDNSKAYNVQNGIEFVSDNTI